MQQTAAHTTEEEKKVMVTGDDGMLRAVVEQDEFMPFTRLQEFSREPIVFNKRLVGTYAKWSVVPGAVV